MVKQQQIKRKPSAQQERVYREIIVTRNNVLIEATAGSGKTTTLVEIASLIPYASMEKSQFCAFNRHTVRELRERLPANFKCNTLHSIGYGIISKYHSNVEFNKNLQIKFIEPIFEKEKNPRKKWKAIYETDELLKIIRATMTPLREMDIKEMMDFRAMDVTDQRVILAAVRAGKKLREYLTSERGELKIDHQAMIEIPVYNKLLKPPKFDYVLFDEAQDASELDLLFMERILGPQSRLIAVGDPNQSIYGFRGASANSFQKIAERPNTVVLPLSTSYRCAKKVVERAQKIYPVIQAYENNPVGYVGELSNLRSLLRTVKDGDYVLARNLKPLVSVYFEMVEAGIKCTIVGKEFEKGLLAILSDYDGSEHTEEILSKFETRLQELEQSLKAKGYTKPKNCPQYVNQEEKLSILRIILSKFSYVYEAEEFIETVFDDEDADGVKLMTCHKSKGLENERVFWITHFDGKRLIPSQYAVTPEQLTQEKNLEFVAVTRAKKELYEVVLE